MIVAGLRRELAAKCRSMAAQYEPQEKEKPADDLVCDTI